VLPLFILALCNTRRASSQPEKLLNRVLCHGISKGILAPLNDVSYKRPHMAPGTTWGWITQQPEMGIGIRLHRAAHEIIVYHRDCRCDPMFFFEKNYFYFYFAKARVGDLATTPSRCLAPELRRDGGLGHPTKGPFEAQKSSLTPSKNQKTPTVQ
jgi:hypothetical protein